MLPEMSSYYHTVVFYVLPVILLLLVYISRRIKCLPPGPIGFPLIGSIPLLSKGRSSEIFIELRQKYGDVFSIRLGQYLFVVLNGYDAIRDAFVKHGELFSDRAGLYVIDKVNLGFGLARSNGEIWRKSKQFTLHAMRGFGFGKQSIESKITEEVDAFLQVVHSKNGKPYDIAIITKTCVANIISSILFGKRFELDDKKFKHLLFLVDTALEMAGSTGIASVFPVLRFVPGDFFHIKKFLSSLTNAKDYVKEIIKEKESLYDENNIGNFVDAFIKERNIRKNKGNWDPTFSDDSLAMIVLDLLIGGSETTASTIQWFILLLIHHRDAQERLYQEIVAVTGASRKPYLADQSQIPFFDAMLTEVFRLKNIVPLALQYGALKDIQYKGYTIPKGAVIVPNLDSAGMDSNEFEDPERFDPSRFIGKDAQLTGHHKVIPFSLGRRACLGESLARNELFLFLTSLVQRYEILPENEAELPTLDGIDGLTYCPRSFKFRAVERK